MSEQRTLKFKEALNEALVQAMDRDPSVLVMGCGVDDEGGIFGTTTGATNKFGAGRVIDTPLAENSIAGIGVGASIMGLRPVIVHARNDFLLLAMDQIINHAAKWNIMSGGRLHCPMLIRAIVGRGWGQAAQHSQSLQALFSHAPGIKVMLPASAYDAKGLLHAALQDNETVLSIEHRLLYETEMEVPEEVYTVPLGEGVIRHPGKDVTLVAFSYMVKEALEAAEQLKTEGIEIEVIDPRCTRPLDINLILKSVAKTRRLVIADTAWEQYGVSAEISAQVNEKMFGELEAPVKRVALPDKNTPCSSGLEKEFYPGVPQLVQAVKSVLGKGEEAQSSHLSEEHTRFQGPF